MGPAPPKYKKVYKRMETDAEFIARAKSPPVSLDVPSWIKQDKLDDFVWEKRKLQRKIVDDVTT